MTQGTTPPGPVLAVCGWSGSGKTTLLREIIPVLTARGLSVATVKHDAHGINVDPKGKDSDHLFQAGADVVLQAPGQSLIRAHASAEGDLFSVLSNLLRRYDLVLVEGHKQTPLPKVWVASAERADPPEMVTEIMELLPWDGARAERLLALIDHWLPDAWRRPPVYAGVLVGARPTAGGELLERVVSRLSDHAEQVALLGPGAATERLHFLPRLLDPPGLDGPLAGILGAMRWAPDATWIVSACNQSHLEDDALDWLLEQRQPGIWAVLPQIDPRGVEPTLAVYDARARHMLESLAASGCLAPSALAGHPRVASPPPPASMTEAWSDVEHSKRRIDGDQSV